MEYTHWQMKNIQQLRKKKPDPAVEIHPETAEDYGIDNNDWVSVETIRGSIKVRAELNEDLMPGVVNLPHGWEGEVNQNVLTSLEPRDSITGYPELRALACKISKVKKSG